MVTPKSVDSELNPTAVHEVGHAIAADQLGYRFDTISIFPNEQWLEAKEVKSHDRFWKAVMDYAGQAAIVVLLGIGDMTDSSAEEHGAGPDFEKAKDRLDGDVERMTAAKDLAVDIVTHKASEIRRIAYRLVYNGRLDERKVQVIRDGLDEAC